MNKILPYHSPAMTGGGVSDNMFKEMMEQMQAGGMPGMNGLNMPGMGVPGPSTPPASGKPKKEKRKIIRA